MRRLGEKGQSTVEYFIVFTVVILVALAFAMQGGVFQNALNATVDKNLNAMVGMANQIFY